MVAQSGGVLRTPDDRFANLPDFGFEPRYIDRLPGFEGLRLHYVDEGPRQASHVFLCLHGQPTWSFLYRRMIPLFLATGARVVAPDLYGFGRSDKPVDEAWYTFSRHRESLLAFIDTLGLQRITLVCQDWGGLLGLTIPLQFPDRFDRLIVMNTALATGKGTLGPGFVAWRDWVNRSPDLDVGVLMRRSCPHLTEAEAKGYDAPFPDIRYKAGARRFPNLVCDRPDADGAALSREALRWWADRWHGRTFMAIGMQDPVIPPEAMVKLSTVIRGCPAPLQLPQAGHFVQEWGDVVATAALDAFDRPLAALSPSNPDLS